MLKSNSSQVLFNTEAFSLLGQQLDRYRESQVPLFILMDSNTQKYCLPLLMKGLRASDNDFYPVVIPAGEESKNINNCNKIWQLLTEKQAGRDAVLLNLGGGMVTDMGGFVASVYKRGIRTIHIPTSLLAMVDAAIGGKTAIDFMGIKNNIGTFYEPEAVLILPDFLKTLPQRELISGLAEVIKYGYIYDTALLAKADLKLFESPDCLSAIVDCVHAKQSIVLADPTEKGQRKILNFGHTVGHAFEALSHEKGDGLLHGEAIAIGMFCELWLSKLFFNMPASLLVDYSQWYLKHFRPWSFDSKDINQLLSYMQHDKKNITGSLRFALIEQAGKPHYDLEVKPKRVKESLNAYREAFFIE